MDDNPTEDKEQIRNLYKFNVLLVFNHFLEIKFERENSSTFNLVFFFSSVHL